MVHYKLEPGANVVVALPSSFNAFVYVISGAGQFGVEKSNAREGQLVSFERDGDVVRFEANSDEGVEILFAGGEPLDEPMARAGPFVMNTEEELEQAFADYQNGRMGQITI